MKFEDIDALVGGLRGIPSPWGRKLYDFVLQKQPTDLLELGFWHGKSSCYTAAALHELGRGRLTTVDLHTALDNQPSIRAMLDQAGLASFVHVATESSSYTWWLKKEIEACTRDGRTVPKYDLCFLDGAHSWAVDGLAFFLVDKLLKSDGYLLLDDYTWSFGTSTALKHTDTVKQMPADERDQMHVKLIFELLVKQHPSYADFSVDDDNWAWARKVHAHEVGAIRTEVRTSSLWNAIRRKLRA